MGSGASVFPANKFAVDCSSRVVQGKSTLATTWIVTPHAWYDLAMKEAVTWDATVALAGGSAGVTVSTPKFLELSEVSGHRKLSSS